MGTRGVGHTIPAAVGSPSVGKLGQQDMRADLPATHLHCAKSILRPPAVGHIYTLLPTRGLIYATTDLAKPTQGTTFTFPTHRRSALAPIVNGLSTDVKLLFCRQIFCLSSTAALFRSPLSGGRNLEWDYARCHPIQSDSILSPSQKY